MSLVADWLIASRPQRCLGDKSGTVARNIVTGEVKKFDGINPQLLRVYFGEDGSVNFTPRPKSRKNIHDTGNYLGDSVKLERASTAQKGVYDYKFADMHFCGKMVNRQVFYGTHAIFIYKAFDAERGVYTYVWRSDGEHRVMTLQCGDPKLSVCGRYMLAGHKVYFKCQLVSELPRDMNDFYEVLSNGALVANRQKVYLVHTERHEVTGPFMSPHNIYDGSSMMITIDHKQYVRDKKYDLVDAVTHQAMLNEKRKKRARERLDSERNQLEAHKTMLACAYEKDVARVEAKLEENRAKRARLE